MTTRLEVGHKAPAFSLEDADGNTVSLADYRGRKLIVYFYPAASIPVARNRRATSATTCAS